MRKLSRETDRAIFGNRNEKVCVGPLLGFGEFEDATSETQRLLSAGFVSRDVQCPDRKKSTSVASARVLTLVISARLYAHVLFLEIIYWKLFKIYISIHFF